jgi:catechol 2,3-dioxygenase-like lactoylglutathione lyase family enzyme
MDDKDGGEWSPASRDSGGGKPEAGNILCEEATRGDPATTLCEWNTEMNIIRLDHLVLTVSDVEATCSFYQNVLGMEVVLFGGGRKALSFGAQRINLHPKGREYEPKALRPTPGSGDLCFVTAVPISEVITHLNSCGIEIIEGPARRTGAMGPMTSVYFRDPDFNLIEVSNYADAQQNHPADRE